MSDNYRIFIVEDNPLNAELAIKLLEDDGHEVSHFMMAEDAIAELENSSPDIILMDMNLPGMNGYDAVTAISKEPKYKDIPVIAFTAMALSGEADRALSCGCKGVIYKPLDVLTFTETVSSYMREKTDFSHSMSDESDKPCRADESRIQTLEHKRSMSSDERVGQLAHDTMTQISILKTGLYYLLNHESHKSLTEKQANTLRDMEKAAESLRTTSRFVLELVGKDNN